MDDCLADHSVLGPKTRRELGQAFLGWLNKPSLQDNTDTSTKPNDGVTLARNVMRWRCQSARIFIYRPILLWYAMRQEPTGHISASKRDAILACRQIAAHLIEDISLSWQNPSPCVMAGWPATWLIYQASMVPMLSLFCDSDCPEVVASCHKQIELVISTLSALESWSCTARRSLEVVTRLYNASHAYQERMQRRAKDRSTNTTPPHNSTEGQLFVAVKPSSGEVLKGKIQGTPATSFSESAGEEFLLGEFFENMPWMEGLDQSVQGVGNDLAFLDYYNV